MKKIIISILTALSLASSLTLGCVGFDYDLDDFYGLNSNDYYDLPDYTDAECEGVLIDLTNEGCLFDDEFEELDALLDDTADDSGFNVGVIITDYIPDANDSNDYQEELVEEYANSCFDKMFGNNGILLLINYHTGYDYILSDGMAEEYITDTEIDEIFDEIELAMVNYDTYSEIEGYANGVSFFVNSEENISDDIDTSVEANDNYSFFNIIISIISLILSVLGW